MVERNRDRVEGTCLRDRMGFRVVGVELNMSVFLGQAVGSTRLKVLPFQGEKCKGTGLKVRLF